jgi:hypothetical protein
MSENNKTVTAFSVLFFSALLLGSALALAPKGFAQYIGNGSPVGWPLFHFKDGSTQCAGKAFAIQWFRNRSLLIMPLHLLSPEAGLNRYIAANNINDEVASVDILDLSSKNVVATGGPSLLRTGVTVGRSMGNINEDVMAFEIKSNTRLPLLALAPTMAPVGTKVWVLSKNEPATNNEPDRFPGKVVRAFITGMTVELDGPITALGSSGAPVVNAQNQVVCMMVGKQDAQRTVIMGIPSTCLYAKLFRELGR